MDDNSSRNGGDFFDDHQGQDNFEDRFFFHRSFGGHVHIDIFQPFREILQSFFSDENFGHNFGSIEEKVSPEGFDSNESPRDRMLKREERMDEFKPRWFENFTLRPRVPNKPYMEHTDTDLDSKISSEGLESVLRDPPNQRPEPKSYSCFKSFSSRTIRTADGKVEEERTVRDSSGKEEKTVRRIFGDQSHTITTLRHPDGGEEVQENLVNLDEGSIADFNQKWQDQREQQLVLRPAPPHSDPGFMNILRKYFGYGPNER